MQPKISIIIPMYNVEKYLRRCLDSVQNQTFKDWQAICIDDGSPDNSGKIAEEYAARDKRFVVVHKKNCGVSAARNDGIKLARGRYIHFMDADDFIDSDYYEKMLRVAESTDADMVCSGFVTNTKYSRDIRYRAESVVVTMYQKLRRTYAFTDGYVWRYLFKKSFINKNMLSFDTNMISQEDAIFVLNAIALANAVAIAPCVFYHYMFNETSALNNRDADHHKKIKQQYKIGKQFKHDFAVKNGVGLLFRFRKLLRRF